MKPVDPKTVPAHMRRRAGKTGLVHGLAPMVPREYVRADARKHRNGRKGRRARAQMTRILLRRFGPKMREDEFRKIFVAK